MGNAVVRFLVPADTSGIVGVARNGYGVIPEVMENHPAGGEVDDAWTERETQAYLDRNVGRVCDFLFEDSEQPNHDVEDLLEVLSEKEATFVACLPAWYEQSRGIDFNPSIHYQSGAIDTRGTFDVTDGNPSPDDPETWRHIRDNVSASIYVQLDLILNTDFANSMKP